VQQLLPPRRPRGGHRISRLLGMVRVGRRNPNREKYERDTEACLQSCKNTLDQYPPEGSVTAEEFERIRRSIGLAVGAIEMHVNVPLYQMFTDLET
jgi:hypothetical protein